MVKLKVPLYTNGRLIPAGEEIALPGQLETRLLEAGNAEPVLFNPLPTVPEPSAVDEDASAPEDEAVPEPVEEIPTEPEKLPRRYGR